MPAIYCGEPSMAATLRGAAKAAPKIAPGNLLLLALCPDPGEGLSVEFLSLALRSVAYHEQSACRAVSEEQSGAKRRSEEPPGKPTAYPNEEQSGAKRRSEEPPGKPTAYPNEEQSGAKRRSEELPGKPTGLPPSRGADGQADCAAPPE